MPERLEEGANPGRGQYGARQEQRAAWGWGMSYCCAMVSKGERERGKEAGCALRWEDANKSPQESVVGERRCRERDQD